MERMTTEATNNPYVKRRKSLYVKERKGTYVKDRKNTKCEEEKENVMCVDV
jgi:hypothetical protein